MNSIYLKKDIVRYMSKHSGYSQAVCKEVLNAYHNLLLEAIGNGDRIQDYGFLDIETVFVPEHYRTDPRDNNIKVKVKDKYKLKITAGDRLKRAAKQIIKNIKNNKIDEAESDKEQDDEEEFYFDDDDLALYL